MNTKNFEKLLCGLVDESQSREGFSVFLSRHGLTLADYAEIILHLEEKYKVDLLL